MAQERKKNKHQQTEAQRLAHRDAVIEHSDNKFVAELTKNMDAFIYTKDFYVALYKQLESVQDRKRKMGSLNQRLRTMMEASLSRRCLK